MMHVDDVGATGVIQEGSRVEYVYLFAGEEALLDDYYGCLQPRLEPSHEWAVVRDGEPFSRSCLVFTSDAAHLLLRLSPVGLRDC